MNIKVCDNRKALLGILLAALILLCCTSLAFATADVSGAIEDAWQVAATQIKTVVNRVVFPAIDLILAVFFFAKLSMCYFDYKKQGQFDWTPPAILFVCLVFALTAPLYIWQVLGI